MKSYLFLLILAASVARGQSDESRITFLYPADPSSPPVVSMSQRFVFRGFDRRDGTRLAAWTEDIANRLERRMKRRIPFSRFDMIRIEGAADPRESGGSVYVGQGVAGGSLQQRVVVTNPEHIEAEALLEGMVQVLLNRYVVADYFSTGGLPEGSLIPDWLSVGMAQGLREDLRQRNLDYALKNWAGGGAPSATAVLGMTTLPAGRAPEKAYCAVLLDWLESVGGGADLWPILLRQCAEPGDIDAQWLAKHVLDLGKPREMNQTWDLWLADKTGNRTTLGQLGFAEVAKVEDLLDIRLIDYGMSPVANLSRRFSPGDLIEYKNEDWARTVALQMLGKLREAQVGQAPDLVSVLDKYVTFFAGFNLGERGSQSATWLSKRLDEAERAMTLLEKSVALHAHYLNQVEQQQQPATLPEATSVLPEVEEKRRNFLNRIEQQQTEEGQP